MGSRFHQLSNGLYVSGQPEQLKEKPTMTSSMAMPYTGGDIKKSGELGKMFDISAESSKSRKSGPVSNPPARTGSSGGVALNSGPIMPSSTGHSSGSVSSTMARSTNRQKSTSGPLRHGDPTKRPSGPQSGGVTPMARQSSGPLTSVLPTTGLITSGPISSGPLSTSGTQRKVAGPLDSSGSAKIHNFSVANNQSVNNLGKEGNLTFEHRFPKLVLWCVVFLFVMGFIAGGFFLGAVHNPILLAVVAFFFSVVVSLFVWNVCWSRRALAGFVARFPDAELRTAQDGQYVKVTGIVTCGNVPLESSFLKVPRCVYTSTSLHEYRGWGSKIANTQHRRFTWGLRSLERHAVDFYISDFQSGLRALVKAGYSAKVTPYVNESIVVDISGSNKELPPEFVRWLAQRNLSSDDRKMRMKEGYIKEGSTVSVLGQVQRNNNVLMIVPPSEPVSTGCHWAKCMLPATLDGLVLSCEDPSKIDVIPV